jgi:hypothetical protein
MFPAVVVVRRRVRGLGGGGAKERTHVLGDRAGATITVP